MHTVVLQVIKPIDHIPVVGKKYILHFKYCGKINPYQLSGIYYTSYTDINGKVQ